MNKHPLTLRIPRIANEGTPSSALLNAIYYRLCRGIYGLDALGQTPSVPTSAEASISQK